jgi:hypothetical protein
MARRCSGIEVLQLLEFGRVALVHSIALQSVLDRTIGREGLKRKDEALEHSLLEHLG